MICNLNILTLILLIVISFYIICKLSINKEEFQSGVAMNTSTMTRDEAKAFNEANKLGYRGCKFPPEGDTELACRDRCSHPRDKYEWGGDNCTPDNCEKICGNCTNEFYCKWQGTTQEQILKSKVPTSAKIALTKKEDSVTLYWTAPDSQDPIFDYILVIESDNIPGRIRSDIISDTKCTLCEYNIYNLINYSDKVDTVYNISLFSRNKYGYSKQSNIISYVPEQTEYISNPDLLVNEKEETNRNNQFQNYVYTYDNDGNVTSIKRINYRQSEQEEMFKKLTDKNKFNTNIKSSYSFNLS